MRIYLETSILADWFFVRTVMPTTRKKMTPQILASYGLVEETLRGHFHKDSFVTSYWAILEATGVLKRARVEFKLFQDNVSLSYYSRLKDKKGFRLEKQDAEELNDQLSTLMRRGMREKRLEISERPINVQQIIDLVTLHCLDPTDAAHVVYAAAEECQMLVTRDSELLERKEILEPVIGLVHPADLLGKLTRTARRPAK